jgi:ribulose-bisphosphate carboxylase large chain
MARFPDRVAISGLKGDRFTATCRVIGDIDDARENGAHIAIEQTVEFPADLLPAGDITDQIIGRVTEIKAVAGHAQYDLTISEVVQPVCEDLVRPLGVVFGNVNLLPDVRIVSLDLLSSMSRRFRGPRFGTLGLRDLVGVTERPLSSGALKPLGLNSPTLAAIAGTLARGGVELVKDDQPLVN